MSIVKNLIGKMTRNMNGGGVSGAGSRPAVEMNEGKAERLEANAANLEVLKPDIVGSGLEVYSRSDAYKMKPKGLSDEEYDYLLKNYSPDAISKYTDSYDPARHGGYYERIYKTSVLRPEGPDKKRIRNAKIAGTISDALGLLGQMWAAGNGVDLGRKIELSGAKRASEREKELLSLYKEKQSQYDKGLESAQAKDLKTSMEEYTKKSEEIRQALWQKRMEDMKGDKKNNL